MRWLRRLLRRSATTPPPTMCEICGRPHLSTARWQSSERPNIDPHPRESSPPNLQDSRLDLPAIIALLILIWVPVLAITMQLRGCYKTRTVMNEYKTSFSEQALAELYALSHTIIHNRASSDRNNTLDPNGGVLILELGRQTQPVQPWSPGLAEVAKGYSISWLQADLPQSIAAKTPESVTTIAVLSKSN